ncbi:MAG: hypothetical protein A2487_03980 [Candidatus Raymondbacteria bacterium RifOxyC12_full_50_8]|uniref:Transcriptional regulator n=1 Tax=Candidatus Raymondbacteria bacterium RIFOXYD12_FULL_49_13 TaxID=1817890 RepID=A0A1F7FGQ1_UNCRA|nr:MAG: hypothetical protein A2248_04890 [Candidatus Raymondbacteria bacterium RIFOXYA2_FULL_49_16]OGK00679.1 MAG: hypothetical protein A2350_00570 [Candidatus Raymondbacteria bacterium RifOxyB12_full_50_8]OGK03079.1 MAG: hypothetical protein A2487_03980 [Candidatus Raymondbacteria bacterium RifOxyC12_full_50_8]OGK05880.1 MAG: hypothetical protein A2519_04065 [Candidatus Raymondbacteria bacterium RIFOXYD12_FULL_49_13]OGP43374.1 MAG: hypothetical protein A2324_02530 [Candidatus Raymondbacteria b
MKFPVFFSIFLGISSLHAADPLVNGCAASLVTIRGESGGRTDGTPWTSADIKGKVFTLYYVDPDERDLNEPAYQALKAAKFPDSCAGSIAVINTGATWMPDYVLWKLITQKQKEYPKTIYVLDRKKVLVRKWGLADHSSVILAFDRQGKVLFLKNGKASDSEIQELLKVIRENI